jgi:AcrR family transcriptional regulator
LTDPIQQQLQLARKAQILDAAAVVFAEKGFHPTTIRDIAKQAGIADGTVYNYFDSKSALLVGLFERMRDTILQTSQLPASAQAPEDLLMGLFLQHPLMMLRADNFALLRIVIAEMMVNEELRTLFYQQILLPTLEIGEATFAQWGTARNLSADEVRLLVRSVAGMVLGLILTHIMGDPLLQKEWERLPALLSQMILHGVGPHSQANDNDSFTTDQTGA